MNRLFISILIVMYSFVMKAQNINELFFKMPEDLVVQLDEAWRKDLVELYTSGKNATLENTMHGKSTLQKLTDNYLLLQNTAQSTIEMKLLPLVNNTNIICFISTVYAPVGDSKIRFFTTEWEELNSADLFTPATKESFYKEKINKESYDFMVAVSLLDMDLVKYSLNVDNTELNAEYTTPMYLDSESKEKVYSVLSDKQKTYEWKKSRYE
jgi:hypothetical protein